MTGLYCHMCDRLEKTQTHNTIDQRSRQSTAIQTHSSSNTANERVHCLLSLLLGVALAFDLKKLRRNVPLGKRKSALSPPSSREILKTLKIRTSTQLTSRRRTTQLFQLVTSPCGFVCACVRSFVRSFVRVCVCACARVCASFRTPHLPFLRQCGSRELR